MDVFKRTFFLICTDENADVISFSEFQDSEKANEALREQYANAQRRMKKSGFSENEFIPRYLSDDDAVIFWNKGKSYLRFQVQNLD